MAITKPILKIVPGLQSLSLVAKASKLIPKKIGKKISHKKIVKTGIGTIVGIGLIKPTASMIGKL